MKRIAYVLASAAFLALLISMTQTSTQSYGEEWWNGSWHYRVKITVNTSYFERYDWPVEYGMNFTSLLEDMNVTEALDGNSTRVLEINSSGSVLHEIPSQFDPGMDYDPAANAAGTITFILNGTTSSHTERWFYVYFDTQANSKQVPSYSTIINKSWDGDEFRINFNNESGSDYTGYFTFDTERGENTSGLYQYNLKDEFRFIYSSQENTTREFIQTTDGSVNYTYDLRGNASFSEGPARIRVHQEGYEVYWNDPGNRTNMTYMKKDYIFYPNKTWFVVEHEIININSSSVARGSYAGISGLDVLGAYKSGYKVDYDYSQDPGSMVSSAKELGTDWGGYGHVWENGTSNFRAENHTTGSAPNYDRIGINLSMTTIEAGGSIQDRAVVVFYHTVNSPDLLIDTTDMLINNVNVTQGEPEMWLVVLEPEPDHDIYNMNESAVLGVNVSIDDWGILDHVNATLDMGTPGVSGDDVTIQLLDDGSYPDQAPGDGFFASYYNFTDSETAGYWNMTVRSYSSDNSFLNESYYTFNLTDEFIIGIYIWNETGIMRIENATINVSNYRQDTMIPGATLNCTTAGDQVPPGNVTDNGDGTYLVMFQTPLDYGLYPLNCSAAKDGSWGFKIENYTVEAPETNISLTPSPAAYDVYNVTFYGNESFELTVTLQNMENSTAYAANVTLDLPAGLSSNSSFEECGNVLISLSCQKAFNITVLNATVAGGYDINMTINWTNRIGTKGSNTSSVTVTVHENPVLGVLQDNVTGILPPGASSQVMATLDVRSLGNNNTNNVSFTSINLDNFSVSFSPPSIPFMTPGGEQAVQVMASVPAGQFPGIYEGWINATSDNGGYVLLNATVIVTGTNVSIETTPDEYTALYVTALSNESLEFSVNVTNTGNTTAFNSYVNVSLPSSWYINQTNHSCGNLSRGSTCMSYFFVNITKLTHAGNYTINATIFWEDIGISQRNESSAINVSVTSNVTLEVDEQEFEKVMEHGTSVIIGNMTVRSTGNDDVQLVDFNLSGEFDNFTMAFNQTYPFNMTPGDVSTVRINATIPLGFEPGYYNGTLNVSSDNSLHEILQINVTVPQNGSWVVNATYCEHAQSPNSGVVCDVLINNTGNVMLNFSVSPSGANHSSVSDTSFNLSKQNSTILRVSYDMGAEAGTAFFSTNYTIDPQEPVSDPDNLTLAVVLNPYVEPLVEIGMYPDMQQQGGSVGFVVNVTSQSGADLDDVILTVQRPNGTNDTVSLGFSHRVFWLGEGGQSTCKYVITDPDDKFCYVVSYPGGLGGNSTGRGNYTAFVYANDTYAVNATNTSQFRVYTRYMVDLDMPDTSQGNWESVNYRARDYLGAALSGASVNMSIKDPENRTVYMLSGKEYNTDENGWVSDNVFVIPASATTGEYTVYTNGTYYDTDVGLWVSNETSVNFNVSIEHTLSGEVAIPTPVVITSGNVMPISVITLEGFQPTDPDEFNVTIYYTEGYSIQLVLSLDMSDFTRNTTGFYTHYENSDSFLSGSYVALLRVKKGDKETYDIHSFRMSEGGPYDVWVTLDQSQIDPGNYLNFNITVWNKGEVNHQDVIIDYWVAGAGQTWDNGRITPNILAGEQKTFRIDTSGLYEGDPVLILGSQPAGWYTLNVTVLYDPTIPSAPGGAGFYVTGEEEQPPEEEGGGGGGEEAGGAEGVSAGPSGSINITELPDQVGLVAGIPRSFNIKVTAEGGPVSNVWFEFQNIPASWVITNPVNISRLAADESTTVTVQITVPRGEEGEKTVRVVVHSTESTHERDFLLRIFTSKKDLINFELVRLRAKLDDLRDRSEKAAQSGFDTGEVDDLLDDAEGEIRLAEGYLKEELYDAALDSIYTAWRLLDEAEDLLDSLLAGITIPWWLLVVAIFAVVIAGLLLLYRKISQNLKILIRGRLSEARQVAGTVSGSGIEIERLREEKSKTTRMMVLLESQMKQGLISNDAYQSLKKRNDQKIAELDKRIRQAIKG